MEDDLNSREEFIGLYSLEMTNAGISLKMIKDILLRVQISLSKCRSQCYDGCSTMKGQKAGVSKQIKDIEKKTSFIGCYAHVLNLAVGDANKNSEIMKEALETTHEIAKLIKKSPERGAKLNALKNKAKIISNSEKNHTEPITLLCPTRWTVRAKSLNSIMSNYTDLKKLWEWATKNCAR